MSQSNYDLINDLVPHRLQVSLHDQYVFTNFLADYEDYSDDFKIAVALADVLSGLYHSVAASADKECWDKVIKHIDSSNKLTADIITRIRDAKSSIK